jgi:hypothetical protein
VQIRFVPLRGAFPKPRRFGVNPPFKTGHTDTLRLLERELRHVNAIDPVVQLALHERQFTLEGRPYAQATPEHPGVIVSFRKRIVRPSGERIDVPLSFPCNTYRTWEANLRAIAIALEDLRRIDRYGVSQGTEQYLGFKALPPPGPDHPAVMTVDAAARLVLSLGVGAHDPHRDSVNKIIADRDAMHDIYQQAAKRLHPDGSAHDADAWARLQAAKNLLEQNYGSAPAAQ